MRVFSKITRTEIEASPIVDGQTGKLLGFQENGKGPIMPAELYVIPYMVDWVRVKYETLMAVLPGVAARHTAIVQSNVKYQTVEYSTEQAIVEESKQITDTVVSMLQEQQELFFSAGAEAIRKERCRQVLSEGYDMEHDKAHGPDMFIKAAMAYLRHYIGDEKAVEVWPFDTESFKPKDKERDIERAGALLAAGLDLLYGKKQKS